MSTNYNTDGTKTRTHPKRTRPTSDWGPWRDVNPDTKPFRPYHEIATLKAQRDDLLVTLEEIMAENKELAGNISRPLAIQARNAIAKAKGQPLPPAFQPFTVIVRCPCGCGLYDSRKVNATNYDSAIQTATKTTFGDRHKRQPLELVLVLKGHSEEA